MPKVYKKKAGEGKRAWQQHLLFLGWQMCTQMTRIEWIHADFSIQKYKEDESAVTIRGHPRFIRVICVLFHREKSKCFCPADKTVLSCRIPNQRA